MLCKVAEYCKYSAVLDDMLRDRLVCGIRHKGVQHYLLQETDLTFSTALKVALSVESADKDAERLMTAADKDMLTERPQGTLVPPVHNIGQTHQPQYNNKGQVTASKAGVIKVWWEA